MWVGSLREHEETEKYWECVLEVSDLRERAQMNGTRLLSQSGYFYFTIYFIILFSLGDWGLCNLYGLCSGEIAVLINAIGSYNIDPSPTVISATQNSIPVRTPFDLVPILIFT